MPIAKNLAQDTTESVNAKCAGKKLFYVCILIDWLLRFVPALYGFVVGNNRLIYLPKVKIALKTQNSNQTDGSEHTV